MFTLQRSTPRFGSSKSVKRTTQGDGTVSRLNYSRLELDDESRAFSYLAQALLTLRQKKMTTRSMSAKSHSNAAADATTITTSVQHRVSTSELISLSDDVLQLICKNMSAKDIYAVSLRWATCRILCPHNWRTRVPHTHNRNCACACTLLDMRSHLVTELFSQTRQLPF